MIGPLIVVGPGASAQVSPCIKAALVPRDATSVEGQAVGQQPREAPLLFCSRTIHTIIQKLQLILQLDF